MQSCLTLHNRLTYFHTQSQSIRHVLTHITAFACGQRQLAESSAAVLCLFVFKLDSQLNVTCRFNVGVNLSGLSSFVFFFIYHLVSFRFFLYFCQCLDMAVVFLHCISQRSPVKVGSDYRLHTSHLCCCWKPTQHGNKKISKCCRLFLKSRHQCMAV